MNKRLYEDAGRLVVECVRGQERPLIEILHYSTMREEQGLNLPLKFGGESSNLPRSQVGSPAGGAPLYQIQGRPGPRAPPPHLPCLLPDSTVIVDTILINKIHEEKFLKEKIANINVHVL